MPDELPRKQRWREVPPSSDEERWILDNPPPLPAPPDLPPLPHQSSREPPLSLEDDILPMARQRGDRAGGRDTFRPPDDALTERLRRQRAAAQPKPIGSNTLLAAMLAIGAIALIVILTIYLAKRS